MAVVTPQSDLYLLKCPLEMSNDNQLTFANATAQFNYFWNLPKGGFENFTYQRKDGVIRFPGRFDDVINYNYVMYRNDAWSSKWFYAFIDKVEYVSDGVVAITIKTDVWQTWQFDLSWKPMFVEREHVTDDVAGYHTVPEGLELGDYVANGTAHEYLMTDRRIIAAISDLGPLTEGGSPFPDNWTNTPIYGGIPSGLTYVVLRYNSTIPKLTHIYDQAGKADAINSIFVVPKAILQDIDVEFKNESVEYGVVNLISAKTMATYSFNRPGSINGYTPINKKLLTYPYSYFYVTNNSGSDVEMRWENFTNATPAFTIKGVPQPGCSIKLYPNNYKGLDMFYNEGIIGAKTPVCGWNSDTYTNWVTQNGINQSTQLGLGLAGAALATVANPALGAAAGLSYLQQSTQMLHQETRARMLPDQAHGNINGSDINWAVGKCGFTFYPMSIKAEYARIIDNYFSAFGYKINRIKVPNIHTRQNWNFIKTNGCYIEGNVPQEDIAEIKKFFDDGITLWHNPSTFRDYSQANPNV